VLFVEHLKFVKYSLNGMINCIETHVTLLHCANFVVKAAGRGGLLAGVELNAGAENGNGRHRSGWAPRWGWWCAR
jgi:hypothetical protein